MVRRVIRQGLPKRHGCSRVARQHTCDCIRATQFRVDLARSEKGLEGSIHKTMWPGRKSKVAASQCGKGTLGDGLRHAGRRSNDRLAGGQEFTPPVRHEWYTAVNRRLFVRAGP